MSDKFRNSENGKFISEEKAAENILETLDAKAAGDFSLTQALEALEARVSPEERLKAAQARAKESEQLIEAINPASEQIKRAQEQEKSVRTQIDFLNEQPDGELKDRRLTQAFNRLAELRAEQGDYAYAALIALDAEKRAYFSQVSDAIKRSPEERCDCADDRFIHGNREFDAPKAVHDSDIIVHNELTPLYRCHKCGFMNTK